MARVTALAPQEPEPPFQTTPDLVDRQRRHQRSRQLDRQRKAAELPTDPLNRPEVSSRIDVGSGLAHACGEEFVGVGIAVQRFDDAHVLAVDLQGVTTRHQAP